MTLVIQAHDRLSRNRRHKSTPFSGDDFWCTCVSCKSSGNRFRRRLKHCSIPSQKVACTWLKWWLHWSIIVDVFMCCEVVVCSVVICFVYNIFSHVYFRRQKSFQMRKERKTAAPKNGVDLWRQFLERVSWVLVVADKFTKLYRPNTQHLDRRS